MELTEEEKGALEQALKWVEEDGPEWRNMDDGYVEACILALLIKKLLDA